VAINWNFGDGGTASGGAVTHAFGAAGAFTVTVAATDAVGNATSTTRPIVISPKAPPKKKRITSKVRVTWGVAGKKVFLLRLSAGGIPKRGKLELRCKGKGCPFKRTSAKKRKNRTITLFKEIKASKVAGKKQRTFRAGQKLEVRITAPKHIGKVVRYKLKAGKIPSGRNLCLPIGKKTPRKRCT
jgi:PKD repeat protein